MLCMKHEFKETLLSLESLVVVICICHCWLYLYLSLMVAFEIVVSGCISYFVDNYYNFLPCERNTPHLLSRYEKHVNKPSLCQKRKEKESKIYQLAAEKKTYCNVSLKMKIRAHLVFRARCWGQPKIFLSVKASIINHKAFKKIIENKKNKK